jgi:D-alanyl-D-alanine carboxypeptidase
MFLLRKILLTMLAVTAAAPSAFAGQSQVGAAIDAYIRPYAKSNNFSGVVRVERRGTVVYQRAWGMADRERGIFNTATTRFHIASMSMQFTAAAVLRLVDLGQLTLDSPAGEFLPDTPGASRITVRDLLEERSGLPDINSAPDYDRILQQHQTPATLVAAIAGQPLLFAPGAKYLHEEHSAYNLLALMIEKVTGLPFSAAVRKVVLRPLGLRASFVDDDATAAQSDVARGYEPLGVDGLEPAAAIHWSAKAGNASMCTTPHDEARFMHALFAGHALSASSRAAALDTTPRVGYGWFRGMSTRFSQMAWYMNGRSPGFSSFALYLPREDLTVVVFSNIYSSATTDIGNDIADIALALPHGTFQAGAPLSRDAQMHSLGTFQFGADFFQKNAKLVVVAEGPGLALRWPAGDLSPLIPLTPDHFRDRTYWEKVQLDRDAAGQPTALAYGEYRGTAVP